MTVRLIGAILVICACGAFGFYMSAAQKREEAILRELVKTLDFIANELQCRLTPLPLLIRQTSHHCTGKLKKILELFAMELEMHISPNADICMNSVLCRITDIPDSASQILKQLGSSFGVFQLDGQLKELSSLRKLCSERVVSLSKDKEKRYRSYQTLGLCAGAALAILLI